MVALVFPGLCPGGARRLAGLLWPAYSRTQLPGGPIVLCSIPRPRVPDRPRSHAHGPELALLLFGPQPGNRLAALQATRARVTCDRHPTGRLLQHLSSPLHRCLCISDLKPAHRNICYVNNGHFKAWPEAGSFPYLPPRGLPTTRTIRVCVGR